MTDWVDLGSTEELSNMVNVAEHTPAMRKAMREVQE